MQNGGVDAIPVANEYVPHARQACLHLLKCEKVWGKCGEGVLMTSRLPPGTGMCGKSV